ncbi:hypothetical protein Poli38472_008364 [Pythium oligandrum]|uniref:Uncharacterized protein n=1 Tax=Pythium oligandrum TaxID=41045 RepID=A0A8K1CLJ6_PYTOL|nr:hypothetical protein Poli38472_008364 [Pythium oligandrum]|eukprot:TMW65722.1 hypothetical protein Poli38472_008364 [Pythium oligandrum]
MSAAAMNFDHKMCLFKTVNKTWKQQPVPQKPTQDASVSTRRFAKKMQAMENEDSASSTEKNVRWRQMVISQSLAATTVCLLELQDCTDGFRLTTKQLTVLSVLGGLSSSAGGLLLSFTVGYPVPFGAQASAPFLQIVLGIGIFVYKGKFFKETPTARPQLRAALRLFGALSILTLVYTACHTAFIKLSGFVQSVSVLSFPLMKILWKNLMALHCRDLEDEKPKLVVMNIEIFHALFSTYCMQGASSFATTVSIIAADLLHSWLSLRDVNVRVNRILRLEARKNQRKGPQSAHVAPPTDPVLDVPQLSKLSVGARMWRWILQMDARVQSGSIQIQRPPRRPETTASILPSPPPYPSNTHDSPPIEAVQDAHPVRGSATKVRLSPEERGARLQTKKQELLHLTECVLLVEYVEIIIPFIYGVYAYICFHLPVHHFYVHLRNLDEAGLRHAVSNVLVYASMEFLTFVMLNCALGQKLPVKPMYQLAFVLETQWLPVQQKLQFWTLFTILHTLQHFGVDFTLKFQWLHTK